MIFNFKTTGGGDGKYLPLTGGNLSGNVTIESDAGNILYELKNSNRNISLGVYPNGNGVLYDLTSSKSVINMPLNGTNTFNGTASGNLPLTGGTVNGNVEVEATDTSQRAVAVKNSLRRVSHFVSTDGAYSVYDSTNGKNIIRSEKDGTNTFNGTASGNLPLKNIIRSEKDGTNTFNGTASGNLPLDGGGEVTRTDAIPIRVKNTIGNTAYTRYSGKDGVLGFLGFGGENTPVYMDKDGKSKTILHTGNSAKVHIGTSAPSDTTALWIDTSA